MTVSILNLINEDSSTTKTVLDTYVFKGTVDVETLLNDAINEFYEHNEDAVSLDAIIRTMYKDKLLDVAKSIEHQW